MSEREFGQSFDPTQDQLEKESSESHNLLNELEQEKIDESLEKTDIDRRKDSDSLKKLKPENPIKKSTADFIEKHGDIIAKREKKHTGKGIKSPRSPKTTSREIRKYDQLKQELKDYNISHRGGVQAPDFNDLKNEYDIEVDTEKFDTLFAYFNESEKIVDKSRLDRYRSSSDRVEKLALLRSMPLAEAIECMRNYSESDIAYRYFVERLYFYQNLVENSSSISQESMRLGLLRDLLYASMQGTPEMGALKIANKRIKETNPSSKGMATLFGYYSGIFQQEYGSNQNLGVYPVLSKTYENARRIVEAGVKKAGAKASEQEIEHKAVIRMANWLMDVHKNYYPTLEYAGYNDWTDPKEALAWAQLGDETKEHISNIRKKVRHKYLNFRNIERFVGKSGDNKYTQERKRLYWQINNFDTLVKGDIEESRQPHLEDYAYRFHDLDEALKAGNIDQQDFDSKKEVLDKWFEENKTNFLGYENQKALEKQEKWREREFAKLQAKLEKELSSIQKLDLPEDERRFQIESVQAKHDRALADITADYEKQSDYFRHRTSDQLFQDLKERQTLVQRRYEKRKSLAEKAFDLHRRFNDQNEPFNGIIDWVNYAPMGTIKKAHKMFTRGASDEGILEMAVTDIIAGARGINTEDLNRVKSILQKVKSGDYEARNHLSQMLKVGNIVSLFDYEVSFDEVADWAGKKFYGMTPALREYGLQAVREFMKRDLDLHAVVDVKKITERHGQTLQNDRIAEIASHNFGGLDMALSKFTFEDVMTLLKRDVNLPVATAILDNTKKFGYNLSIDQIGKIAKNVNNIEDFVLGLQNLSLDEVEKIASDGIAFNEFSEVKEALRKHQHDTSFDSVHALAKKILKTKEYGQLDSALAIFKLKQVEQILDKGFSLRHVSEVTQALKDKSIKTDLQETMLFTQYAGDWNKGSYVTQAIDIFGIDNVRKIVAKSCRLDKALEVNNYIRNNGRNRDSLSVRTIEEVLTKGGIEAIIAITKAGNAEVALKTIEAGFTVEEITRFPFLISRLVTQP